MSVYPSVRACVRLLCISAVPTGRISLKCDIVDFYKNLSRKSKFGYKLANVSGRLPFIGAGEIKLT
jgi:hypothetical protein